MPLLGVQISMCALGMGTGLGRSGQVATGLRSPSPSAVDSLANLHSKERLPATDPDLGICLASLLGDHGVWRWDIQIHIEVTGYNCA